MANVINTSNITALNVSDKILVAKPDYSVCDIAIGDLRKNLCSQFVGVSELQTDYQFKPGTASISQVTVTVPVVGAYVVTANVIASNTGDQYSTMSIFVGPNEQINTRCYLRRPKGDTSGKHTTSVSVLVEVPTANSDVYIKVTSIAGEQKIYAGSWLSVMSLL